MHDRWPRTVLHADMDAFYAAVEQLDNSDLRGRPVLVGPNSRRGVVLTASYEARPYGVGSAMPMAQALDLCPQAVVVPPRFRRYEAVSARIMAIFRDFSPSVEAISLDEAFLDMTGAEALFGEPRAMGEQLRQAILEETGLHASVGIAASKYVAKVASGIAKPRGIIVVSPEETLAFLSPLPVSRLWGAGPKTQARLQALDLHTIGEVATAPAEWLEPLGSLGIHFQRLARGEDPRPVQGGRRSRSMGSERTLERDVIDPADIARHLQRSADRVARRLRSKRLLAGGVRVRLKTTDFRLHSRQCTLRTPTNEGSVLLRASLGLLDRFDVAGPYRLVGLTAFALRESETAEQLDLLADDRQRRLEVTLDALTARFGDGAIRRARDLNRETVLNDAPMLDGISGHSGSETQEDER